MAPPRYFLIYAFNVKGWELDTFETVLILANEKQKNSEFAKIFAEECQQVRKKIS